MKSKTKITARYAETDQMGIIHHAVYPIWYEVARTDFIKALGMTYLQMEQTGVMLPLVEMKSRFLHPARYEDELTVETSIALLTPVKIEFAYEIFNIDGKCINRGSTLHAWTDLALHPMNMRKLFPEIYALITTAQTQEKED